MIIKHNFETIIRNWWLKNLEITCYPCIQITFDLIIYFWMPFLFYFLGSQAITHFHGSSFLFCSYNTTFCCFWFNIQYVGEKTQWFPSTWFLGWFLCRRQSRNVIYDSIWSRHHISIYYILEVLLVNTLTCMLIYLFMLFKYLCSKEDLLHNYWSIPIVFIWSSRRNNFNIHLIITHCCSTVSIEGIE